MLYGCETWRLSERNKRALEAILFLWPLRILRREIKNEETTDGNRRFDNRWYTKETSSLVWTSIENEWK